MKSIYVTITPDKQIKGQELLLDLLRKQKPGTYRHDIYDTNRRSNQQNRYLHALFTLCVKGLATMGYLAYNTPELAKKFYKESFLSFMAVNEKTGLRYTVVRKTSSLSKDEMTEFIDQIRENQLEYGGNYIPTPEEYLQQAHKWDLAGLAT